MARPQMCTCQSERRAADKSGDESASSVRRRSSQLAGPFSAHVTHFKGLLAKQGLVIVVNILYKHCCSHDFSSLIIRYPSHGEGIKCSSDGCWGRLNTSDLLSCRKTHPRYPPDPRPGCPPTASVEALSVDVCTSAHTRQVNYK